MRKFEETKRDYRRLDDAERGFSRAAVFSNDAVSRLMNDSGIIDIEKLFVFIRNTYGDVFNNPDFTRLFARFFADGKLNKVLREIPRKKLPLALKAVLLKSANWSNISLYQYPGSRGERRYDAENDFDAFDGGGFSADTVGCCGDIELDGDTDCLTGFELGYLAGDGCNFDCGDNDDGAACLAICACIACLITVYVTVMSLVACAGTGLKVMGSARDERNQPDTKFGRLLKGIALGLVLLGAAYLWYGTPGADHSIAAGITSAIAGSSKSSKPDGLSGLEIFGGFIGYGYGGLVAMVSMSALACCILGTCVFRCCGFDPLKYLHKQGDIALKQSGITEDQFNELKGSDYTDLFLEAQKSVGRNAVKALMHGLDAVKGASEYRLLGRGDAIEPALQATAPLSKERGYSAPKFG